MAAVPARLVKDWPARWNFWNGTVTRHRIDPAQFPRNFRDWPRVCGAIYQNYAAAKGASIGGEKSPTFHDHLPYVARMFPSARYIILWRSPLGICSSMARAARTSSWYARCGMQHRALMGCEELRRGCQWLRANGHQVHELSYDELTANPETSLRAICKFLGISYEPQMIVLGNADRSAILDAEHHRMVKSDGIAKPQTTATPCTRLSSGRSSDTSRCGAESMEQTGRPSRARRWWSAASLVHRANPGSFSVCVLRGADLIVRFCLSLVPIRAWEGYRRLRYKDYRARYPNRITEAGRRPGD